MKPGIELLAEGTLHVNHANRLSAALMRSPILWGLLLSLGFFTILHSGNLARMPWGEELESVFSRYCAGHVVKVVQMAVGFVALAALILKAFEVAAQRALLSQSLLPGYVAGDDTTTRPRTLLDRLSELNRPLQATYLYERVQRALAFVDRNETGDSLQEHLKYLRAGDEAKSWHGFGFVRMLMGTICVLGCVTTLAGIATALSNFMPGELEASLPVVMSGLGQSLETTALALVEAAILMSLYLAVNRQEAKLLEQVECRTQEELAGRFARIAGGSDPQVVAVQRMAEAVLKATEQSVVRQAELWEGTISAAHERWSDLAEGTQRQLQAALAGALQHCLHQFAGEIEASSRFASQENLAHWQSVQVSLDRGSESMLTTQRELARLSDVLLQVVQATGEVTRLEELLNSNLAALAGSHDFEQTVQSLAGVVHLLTARLGHLAGPASGRSESRMGHAA